MCTVSLEKLWETLGNSGKFWETLGKLPKAPGNFGKLWESLGNCAAYKTGSLFSFVNSTLDLLRIV
jgi:hypothetical protein